MVDGEASNPVRWRTRCGLAFAQWCFTRHATVDTFPVDMVCRTCFGPGDARPQPAPTQIHSSSSSSSDSASYEEEDFNHVHEDNPADDD